MSVSVPVSARPPAPPDYPSPLRWFRLVIAAVAILVGLTIVVLSFAYLLGGTTTFPNVPSDWWTWLGPLVGILIGLIILFSVIRAIYWSAAPWERRYYRRYYRHHGHAWDAEDSALDSARLRYSRGEISREQYLQLLQDLERPVRA